MSLIFITNLLIWFAHCIHYTKHNFLLNWKSHTHTFLWIWIPFLFATDNERKKPTFRVSEKNDEVLEPEKPPFKTARKTTFNDNDDGDTNASEWKVFDVKLNSLVFTSHPDAFCFSTSSSLQKLVNSDDERHNMI